MSLFAGSAPRAGDTVARSSASAAREREAARRGGRART